MAVAKAISTVTKLNKNKHIDWWNVKTIDTQLQQYALCVFQVNK